MNIHHRSLNQEFPEYGEVLHRLKLADSQFARLAAEYEDVDKQILRIEEAVEAASDMVLKTLKRRYLMLKYQLFARMIS